MLTVLALALTAMAMQPAYSAPNKQAALEQLEVLGLDLQGDAFARAVARKQSQVVELLFAVGANPNRTDADGRSPLFHATSLGDEKLVARLMAAKADVNLGDGQHVTPLMVAAAMGKTALIDALLKRGADINATDRSGRTAIQYALVARQLPAFTRLLAERPSLDLRRCDDQDALAIAVNQRDWKYIQPLLDRIEKRPWDAAGRSLLQMAVDARDVERVRMILSKHDAAPSPEGCQDPLLAYAVAANDLKLAQLLLDAGADPNTALQAPAEPRFLEYTAPKFLKHYLSEENGMTVLMIAAGLGNEPMVRLLLEKGADRYRTTQSKYKLIALYFAAWGDHAECLQTLIGNAPRPDQCRVEVSLAEQRATLYRDGSPVFRTGISSGRKGYSTPTGRFVVTDKKSVHVSTIYKVKMPWFMRLSCRDFGMHEGNVPSYPASHGCIRLPGDAARRMFKEVPVGTLVMITN